MVERKSNGTQEFDLEKRLRELIAERYGVSPDEVTMEFIRQKRAELYARPDHKFIFEDEYGNETLGLKVRNLSQPEAEAKEADAFWKQFDNDTQVAKLR